MALITCENLSVGYGGKVILSGINMTVNEGDYICIAGENGSGKTTLMKTLLHLLPPAAGKVHTGDGLKKGGAGYLPQQTQVQKDFPASVKEIVLSGFCGKNRFLPFYTREQKSKAEYAMERMKITGLSGQCYRELSGGQQKRVLLARAFCASDRIIFLDEPSAALDENSTSEMYSLIEELNKKEGMAIVMITHDTESSFKYASRILKTAGGGIQWL